MTARRRSTLPQKLNRLSETWFVLTITGVFYFGLGHVLPVLYAGYSEPFLWCHHLFSYFMFAQMAVNWACVRFIRSDFRPEDHREYLNAHAQEIANGGYEMNLNELKGDKDGSLSINASSLKPFNGHQMEGRSRPNPSGALYAIEVADPQGGEPKKVIYPYWSWKPCVICQCQRPPRTHHCPICNTCVVKRDHHCFFMGACVGLNNQRHFVVFNFWGSVATLYCLLHSTYYIFSDFIPRNSYWDVFLPFAIIRCLLGVLGTLDLVMVFLYYSVAWFWLTTTGFVLEQVKVIRKGKTSFEEDTNIKVTSVGGSSEHMKAVFGEHWWMNFLVPLHKLYPHTEDGVTWPHVKM